MFTGIINQKGEVLKNTFMGVANRLLLKANFDNLQAGESIAVNGVCLTVLSDKELAFDISPQTLALTTLGDLKIGDFVNLERAMLASSRFGGHYVSGHVDTKTTVLSFSKIEEYLEITVGEFEWNAKPFLLPKGSITLEGVSLTINEVIDNRIKIMLVPHTLTNTTLENLKVGQNLNVEFDYLTRIVVHQLSIAGPLKNEVLL